MRVTHGAVTATPVLLCDADGNLFPSEEPAFEASVTVVNDLMHTLHSRDRFTAQALQEATTGQNFRHTARALAASHGRELDQAELEEWVNRERREVTAHLARSLTPDAGVIAAVDRLQGQYAMSVVSSSALARVQTCLAACGLSSFFRGDRIFSAEDSLPVPRSKPAPDIYRHALTKLQIAPEHALAIEDSLPGVQSAVAAGIPVIGNVVFVSEGQREGRARQLGDAGAVTVLDSWRQIADWLLAGDLGQPPGASRDGCASHAPGACAPW